MAITNATKLGVVTVFDAKIYTFDSAKLAALPSAIIAAYEATAEIGELKSLKTANLVQSGPEISIQGGMDNNILIKHGKSARCEMQDVLANTKALIALGSVMKGGEAKELHTTEKFGAPVTIIGDTFVVNQATGAEEAHKIIIYKFLPDSIFNFNQDSGTAAVFDMNGDMESVEITGSSSAFYSIY